MTDSATTLPVGREREENAYTLGVQAGLWGYPLAHRVEAFPPTLRVKGIGLNSFVKFDRLKTADDRFVVTPNNLTIDAYAIVDVRRGPVVVHVPKLDEPRWYIVQIGDAFDDVICNLGGTRPSRCQAPTDHRPRVSRPSPGDMTEVRPPHEPGIRRGADRRIQALRTWRARCADEQRASGWCRCATTSSTASPTTSVDYRADRVPRTDGPRRPAAVRPPRGSNAVHAAS